MNRLFVLSFENDAHWRSYKQYFLPTVEIKDYSIMIDGKNLFDQPVKNNLITYENIRKITTGQGDDYTNSNVFIEEAKETVWDFSQGTVRVF